jgi:biotin carboxyl carrier protein
LGARRAHRGVAEIAMKYHAVFEGEEQEIEIAPQGSGYRVAIGGRAMEIDAVHLQGSAVSLIVGTRSVRCDVEPRGEGKVAVLVGETSYALEILDERRLRMRRASGRFTTEGPQRIDAPMPGKIVRVLVKAGDEVQEGQGLIVVEAMKMENELKSPKAGKVTELHAQEGANVEAGARLAVVS